MRQNWTEELNNMFLKADTSTENMLLIATMTLKKEIEALAKLKEDRMSGVDDNPPIFNYLGIQPTDSMSPMPNPDEIKKFQSILSKLETESIIRKYTIKLFRQSIITTIENLEKPYDLIQRRIIAMREATECMEKKRDNLQHLWNKCRIDTKERDKFITTSKIYNDNTLKLYENEVEKFENFYKSNQKIFELINEWEKKCEKCKNIFFSQFDDSEKLLDYDYLLLVRKKVEEFEAENLAKVGEQLEEMIDEYEKIQGVPFTIYGLSLLEYFAYQERVFEIELREFIIAKQPIIITMEDLEWPYDFIQKRIVAIDETAESIKKKKEELQYSWDISNINLNKQNKLTPTSKIHIANTLKLYELEVEKLQKFHELNQEIFKMVDKWEEMLEQYKGIFLCQFEDPEKLFDYQNRLVFIEKIEKFEVEKLSKTREQLEQMVNNYERMTGERFTIHGLLLSEYLACQKEHFNMELSEFMIAKQQEIEEKTGKKLFFSIVRN